MEKNRWYNGKQVEPKETGNYLVWMEEGPKIEMGFYSDLFNDWVLGEGGKGEARQEVDWWMELEAPPGQMMPY